MRRSQINQDFTASVLRSANMRKIHRWVSLPASLFLLVVATTGVLLQGTQLFGGDEAEREKQAAAVSSQTLARTPADVAATIDRALAAVVAATGKNAADVRLNGVDLQFRAVPPRVVVHAATGGSEGERFTVDASSGAILAREADGESLLLRIHTGEIFGDAGVFMGLLWGTAMVVLTVTGVWLYWKMYRARASVKGWRRIFWMLLFMTALS